MNKHTPGPWHYKPHGVGSNYMNIFCSSDKGEGDNLRGYCGEPNARLIVSAPQLLEALELMVVTFCDTEGSHGVQEEEAIDKARAAIRKATGE